MSARTLSRFAFARFASLTLAAAMLGGVVLAAASHARAADQPPIVIGTTISATGAYAEDAKPALAGYQLWVKEQNAKGGLLGRQIVLKYYDDTSDPATAVSLYEKLVQQDKVNIIVGPYSSAVTAAVANIADKYKMPMISPEVASTAPFQRGLKYIFQAQAQSPRYVSGALAMAKAAGYKRIALTGEDTAFPKSIAVAVPDLAKAAGLEVVFNELYPHNASDYSAMAQKIKQSNPDVVLGISYFPDSVGLLRALKQLNVTPKLMFFAVGPTELNFGKETGKDADGVMATTNWSSELKTQNNTAFAKDYQDMFHIAPDYHAAANYAALQVLAAAINNAKGIDNEKIREYMATTKVPTVMGTYQVDANNIQTGYDSLTLQWQGGKQYIVYPADLAQRKALMPFSGLGESLVHPELVAQLTIDGLLLGGVFALSALGLNVIFGVTRIVNLAHGQIVVLTALCSAVIFQQFGITPIELLPVAMIAGFLVGVLLEQAVLRRLPEDAPTAETTSLLLTFGVSYFIVGLSLAIFTGNFRSAAYLTGSWQLGAISIGQARFLAFLLAAAIAALLAVVLRATPIGRALRAASQNLDGARVCGVDIARMRTLSFALGTAIAAAAGALLSMIYAVSPDLGGQFTLIAFSVIALGGLGSYIGTLAGAAIMGLGVSFVGYFASTQLGAMTPYILFILVLLFRPTGILGKRIA